MIGRPQFLLAALICACGALAARASETVQVRGGEHEEGYARIAVEWQTPVAFDAKLAKDTLTIHFARPFTASLTALQSELQHYVSQVGQSADGTSIVAVLTRPVEIKTATVNGTIAAVDLVAKKTNPEKTSAKPPEPPRTATQGARPQVPSPEAVVDTTAPAPGAPVNLLQAVVQTSGSLDEPAVAPPAAPAPAATKAQSAPPATSETVKLRGAEHGEGRARIAVEWLKPITFDAKMSDDTLTIRFARPFAAPLASLSDQLSQYVASVEQSPDRTTLTVKLKRPVTIKTGIVDGRIASIDLVARASTPPEKTEAKSAAVKPAAPKSEGQRITVPKAEEKKSATNKPPEPVAVKPPPPRDEAPPVTLTAAGDPVLAPPPRPMVSAATLDASSAGAPVAAERGNSGEPEQLAPLLTAANDRVSLRFDWSRPVGAAVYRRGNAVWLVFASPSAADLSRTSLQGQSMLTALDPMRIDGATAFRLVAADGINPSVRRADNAWIVDFAKQAARPDTPIVVDPRPGPARPSVELHVAGAAPPLTLRDPLLGDSLTIVPVEGLGRGIDGTQDFVDFRLLPSVQGVVIRANSDDLTVSADESGVHITRPRGLILSDERDRLLGRSVTRAHRIFDFGTWRGAPNLPFADRRSALERAIIATVPTARTRPRIDLARFYFANLMGPEALSVLAQIDRDDPSAAADPKLHGLRGAACLLSNIDDCATRELGDSSLDDEPEAGLWRGALAASKGDWSTAGHEFFRGIGLITFYPKVLRNRFALQAAQAMIETDRASGATPLLSLVLKDAPEPHDQAMTTYLQGRVEQQLGELDKALELWSKAAASDDRKARARALYSKATALYEAKKASRADTIKALDALRFAWRGDEFEFTVVRRLGELKLAENDFQGGLETLHLAASYFPDYPAAKDVEKEASDAFADVFIGRGAEDVPPVKALGLYEAFRDLDPPGERHDAIVRKLVDRLVAVDLLDRAADLLDDQVKSRLVGVDKARAATQIALLRLMNHEPDAAIAALDIDVNAGLTPDLTRQRQELRARALLDLSRAPEALAMLGTDNSRDAYRLRADIYWRQRDWKNAAQVFALLAGEPTAGPLDAETARVVLSWAAALTLDGDQASVAKLRQGFGAAMAGTQMADAFNILTGDAAKAASGGGTPTEIAARVAEIGTLQNFMTGYKQRLASGKLSAIN